MEFELLIKKVEGTLTDQEKVIFENWYSGDESHRAYFNRFQMSYNKGLEDDVDIKEGWKLVESRIFTKSKRAAYWKYAAAIAAIFALGLLWLGSEGLDQDVLDEKSISNTDDTIMIGTDRAILTLEDGTQVPLEKGTGFTGSGVTSNGKKLDYTGKSRRLARDLIAYNMLTVPRGGQFFIILEDSTKIWLNSESKIKYPITFSGKNTREIELLYGEAYFEVSPSSKNNGANFIVNQQNQKIEVLGTEFNVKAFRDEDVVITTLVEGRVSLLTNGKESNLTPNQQSTLNLRTRDLDISLVDVYDNISWKTGLFSFNQKTLEEIMLVLSRWYDVEVIFADEELKKMTFNGGFRKSQRINDILKAIKSTNQVNYTIENDKITMH